MNTEPAVNLDLPPFSAALRTADEKESALQGLVKAVADADRRPKAATFREDKPVADRAAHLAAAREHERGATSKLLLKLRLDMAINEARLEAHDRMLAALAEETAIEKAARDDVAAAIESVAIHIKALEDREAGGA